jgi:cytochrome c biogenesis protein CcdA
MAVERSHMCTQFPNPSTYRESLAGPAGFPDMFDGPYALALNAGMLATVNPCGFALLPAYLGAFLNTQGATHGRSSAVSRGLQVSLALTLGFVFVFGLFGAIITPLAISLDEQLPWVTVVIGLVLSVVGAFLVAGKQLTVKLPKLNVGGADGGLLSMFLFGVSYAVASLSCTLAPFLAVTTSTFRSSSWLAGLGVFITYALGMGVVIAVLTLTISLARAGLVQRLRRAGPVINRVAGALMVIAGLYVAWYGWYEIRVLRGSYDDPVIDRALRIQSWLANNAVPDDAVQATVVAVIGVSVLSGVSLLRRRALSRDAPAEAP